MHEYAVTHERTIESALQACGKPEHRRAAAELLGYANKSEAQIIDLVHASHDADESVRNNANRALWVLATSDPKTASEIPVDGFIEILNSAVWEDRNKAGLLLMVLTRSRPPHLLKRLRTEALPSLIEMARWRNAGHAYAYKVMLGRIVGFDDARIELLIQNGKVEEIIAATGNQPSGSLPDNPVHVSLLTWPGDSAHRHESRFGNRLASTGEEARHGQQGARSPRGPKTGT